MFEFTSANLGAQSAFCGGGRYDRLISDISSNQQDQPAIGCAIGIERVMILLELIKDKLPISSEKPLYLILPLSEKQHVLGLLISNQLHEIGFTTDILLDEASVKSMMRKANKLGAKYLLILGDEEQKKREVTLKNMLNGEEQKVPLSDIVSYLKKA